MAFFDLNQNKRKDAEEEYMAYQILRGMTEDEDSEESEDGNFRFVSGEDGGFGRDGICVPRKSLCLFDDCRSCD